MLVHGNDGPLTEPSRTTANLIIAAVWLFRPAGKAGNGGGSLLLWLLPAIITGKKVASNTMSRAEVLKELSSAALRALRSDLWLLSSAWTRFDHVKKPRGQQPWMKAANQIWEVVWFFWTSGSHEAVDVCRCRKTVLVFEDEQIWASHFLRNLFFCKPIWQTVFHCVMFNSGVCVVLFWVTSDSYVLHKHTWWSRKGVKGDSFCSFCLFLSSEVDARRLNETRLFKTWQMQSHQQASFRFI